MSEHELDTTVRPAACTCGKAKYAGSPTFVRKRHAAHVAATQPADLRDLTDPSQGESHE